MNDDFKKTKQKGNHRILEEIGKFMTRCNV